MIERMVLICNFINACTIITKSKAWALIVQGSGSETMICGDGHQQTQCWLHSSFPVKFPLAYIPSNIHSLAPGKFEWHFRYLFFQIISVIDGGWGISWELVLRWMSLDLTDDKSTLVQVMAWCRQATSHYLSQWWHRSLSPYGVTRPRRYNISCVFVSDTLSNGTETHDRMGAGTLVGVRFATSWCHRQGVRGPHSSRWWGPYWWRS